MAIGFKRLFENLSSHVTVWTWAWPYIAGVVGVGAVTGFIAKATAWIEPWGAIGWWAAFLAGVLLAAFVLLLGSIAYSRATDARLRKKIYGDSDKLNPLDNFFQGKRIKLDDLVFPLDVFVRKKTFENCDIIGPYNVILVGRGTLANCTGSFVQAAIVKDGSQITNAIVLEECTIRNCRLYQITFLVPKSFFEVFSNGMNNITWITDTPHL